MKTLKYYNAKFELNYLNGKYEFSMDDYIYSEEDLKNLRTFLKEVQKRLKVKNRLTNKRSICGTKE